MNNGKKVKVTVKYRLFKNNSPTADKAPYLVKPVLQGTMDVDDFARSVHESEPSFSTSMVRMIIDSTREVLTEIFTEHPDADVETPWGHLRLALEGSISEEERSLRNLTGKVKPVLRFYPSKKLREEIENKYDFEFVRVGGPDLELSIRGVATDSLGRAGANVVKPGERFTVTGGGFPDEDPTSIVATIADSAGAEHAVQISLARPNVLECTAPAELAKGKAKLKLTVFLGPEESDGRITATRNVTIA